MNRTKEFFRIATEHRNALKAIWEEYESTVARLERYKGSAGYDADILVAERFRDNAIKEKARETAKAFDAVLQGMREKAGGQAAVPPTEDELRLLEALKMRDVNTERANVPGLTREELKAAGRALQDNTIALHTLDSIAAKHGFHNMFISYPAWHNTASIHQQKIAALTESARRICALTKPNSTREAVTAHINRESVNALQGIRIDRDFSEEREAIAFFGNITETEYPAFADAVND